MIGEGGVKVSGGEKQRLSIARALLRRPHLLVFDEATSSLDSLTEEGIGETIRDVAARRRRDHHPDRAPALDDPARRPHLRPRARPHRRDRAGTTSCSSRRACTTRCGGSRSASGAASELAAGGPPPLAVAAGLAGRRRPPEGGRDINTRSMARRHPAVAWPSMAVNTLRPKKNAEPQVETAGVRSRDLTEREKAAN